MEIRRETSLCRKWPAMIRDDFLRFRRSFHERRPAPSGVKQPYWMLMPQWLWTSFNEHKKSPRAGPRFLHDILWAQHCLFMVLRLQDDLFDGEVAPHSLIYASDLFLLECDRVLGRHFRQSPEFEIAKRGFLRKTIHGIVEADALQSFPGNGYRSLPAEYRRQCALFKLGSFAVCLKAGRMKLFPRVSAYCDQMAVVGQILDDVIDIREDFNRGRLNYAASLILRPRRQTVPVKKRSLRQIASNILRSDVAESLLADLRGHLELAASTIAPLRLEPAAEYLIAYREAIEEMAKQIRRQRVKTLFGL